MGGTLVDLPVLLRMTLAFGLVLLIIFGSVQVVRRLGPLKMFQGRNDAFKFDIVGQAPLGPKRSLTAVRVGGRTLLLGLTPTSINFITELDTEGGPAAVADERTETSARGPFGRELAMALTGLDRSRARLSGEDPR